MPTNVNYQIPFLGGGPSIAEQIMQGLHEGFAEKQQTQQLGIQQQQADTASKRATSDVALQGAQTEEIQQTIRRQKAMMDSLFTPKPDNQSSPSVSTGTAPSAPLRTDFERLVDQSDLPDNLKDHAKMVATFAGQAGKPEAALDFFWKQLDKESKSVVPHVLFDHGLPYGVVNKFGEVHDLEDPAMPSDLAPLAASAKKIYEQKNLLLPDEVTNTNTQNKRLWNVLHPNEPLPADLMLPASATKEQANRSDAHLKGLLAAEGTKAQRDAANAARDASRDRSDEKFGIEPVMGVDKAGRNVLVSQSEAKTMGLTGVMKADADMVNKSTAARHWLQLADKQGDAPESMGIIQLIDKMDSEGKLGTIASRWEEFLAGKVGAGDPEFAALRTKMGLSATKLMQAHVGSRGGSFMLEHFEDLANAGKMDASTLRAGVRSELDYMKDVAMLPQRAAAASATTPKAGGFSPDNPFAPKGPH